MFYGSDSHNEKGKFIEVQYQPGGELHDLSDESRPLNYPYSTIMNC